MKKRHLSALAIFAAAVMLQGCSIRQMAVNALGDSLASGGSIYEQDDDVALVGEALPFSLKLLDGLIAQSPVHRGLLLAASRGYLLYAYAYVGDEAERLADSDMERASAARLRAHKLYLRAHDYAARGLEVGHTGLRRMMSQDPAAALVTVDGSSPTLEIPLLHSAAATLALAIATDKQDAAMLARLPEVDAYLARALELDEAWNAGALHELAVTWLSSCPGLPRVEAVEQHYTRALALSGGRRAGVYVSYAEAMKVPTQKRGEFTQLMNQALAVQLDASPDDRLLNALAQRRARWLLSRLDQLFLE
jgi:predicted anti-sigma-YlaC factor YlaD